MKFIKIDAIIGRQDDKDISQEEMDEFVDSFIEWLEQHGYETCAVWELMDDETEKAKDSILSVADENFW